MAAGGSDVGVTEVGLAEVCVDAATVVVVAEVGARLGRDDDVLDTSSEEPPVTGGFSSSPSTWLVADRAVALVVVGARVVEVGARVVELALVVVSEGDT